MITSLEMWQIAFIKWNHDMVKCEYDWTDKELLEAGRKLDFTTLNAEVFKAGYNHGRVGALCNPDEDQFPFPDLVINYGSIP